MRGPTLARRARMAALLLAVAVAAGVPLAASGESQVSRPGVAGVIRTPTAAVRAVRGPGSGDERAEAAAVPSEAAVVAAQHRVQQRAARRPAARAHAAAARAGSRPCALVSRRQARAILGRPVTAPVQAPLGPTCIYRPVAGAAPAAITLTVQAIAMSRLLPHLRDRQTMLIAGRRAFCARYGTRQLYVPLGPRRVLTVAGPCGQARRFAAAALRRLTG